MEVYVSVRNLVEFILREGDIDNRRAGGSDSAMQEGSRIHRMIQKRMGSEYHAEVPLEYAWDANDYEIIIDGRADGIIDRHFEKREEMGDEEGLVAIDNTGENHVIIDEIKGTYKDLKKINSPVKVHLAQAKCYAFFYASKYCLDSIGVRMTYCNIETEEIKYFHDDFTFDELENWFFELMKEYEKWADFQIQWNKTRTESIKKVEFPFSYREGQKDLVKYVYQTIYHKKKLFIEAPTGVGKTISTVFPAVKAMGEGLTDKIFYLTAKTITRTVAEDCFSMLETKGLQMKTVVITARDKICFLDEKPDCNPESCPYAKGHFDRINDAIYDLLIHENHFSRDKITEYAEKHKVCPFEMGLDMSLFSDAIICDYNYVFDPKVYLKRFFGDAVKKNYAFLIDESHNLLDRGREMYSATLVKEDFLEAKKILKNMTPKVEKLLEKCNKELLSMKRECRDYNEEVLIDSFVVLVNRTYGALDEFLDEHEKFPDRDKVLELYFNMAHFLNMYEIMDSKYRIYTQIREDGSFIIKLFCVDPSTNLKECMERGRSSILFSATLLPIQYYKKLLGGEKEDYEVYAKSVFREDKKTILLARDVTTKYTRRTSEEYEKIAHYIFEVIKNRYGNYMAFFPSHMFLDQVLQVFTEKYLDTSYMDLIVQEEKMSEEKRESFLKHFTGNQKLDVSANISFEVEEEEDRILLGFCVLGGIFSEGIDLKNDSLIGAIIVGTGLPQVGAEREILKKYFDEKGENGFDYAYKIPGMNKVLQSAGRVIRTADDIGVIALLDERFIDYSYRRMFPREWSEVNLVGLDDISKKVEKFWNDWL